MKSMLYESFDNFIVVNHTSIYKASNIHKLFFANTVDYKAVGLLHQLLEEYWLIKFYYFPNELNIISFRPLFIISLQN